jgi:hypothetical protein
MVRFLAILLLFSVSVCYGQANRFAGFGNRNACPAEAELYFTNAGITNATEKSAWCTFVSRAKNEFNIYSKLLVAYPMLGGTATTCKYNAITPTDADASYRAVFFGGWTFSSTGALPNGTNAYADTKFKATNYIADTSAGFTFVSRTNSNGTEIEFGAFYENVLEIRTAGTTYFICNGSVYGSFADANSIGAYTVVRDNSANHKCYKDGVLKATNPAVVAGVFPVDFYFGAVNYGVSAQYYSTKECALLLIHSALTATEVANLNTLISEFKTTLGR